MEAVERAASFVQGATVLPAVVYCGAELLAPGRSWHDGMERFLVPEGEAGRRFAECFASPLAKVRARSDFTTQAWRKLGTNVAGNGLAALTGRLTDALRAPELGAVARALVAECFTVGAVEGRRSTRPMRPPS
nr:ketopantoate reductase C-terminal domain-containing protein [Pseudonocardia kunmingensis]